MELSKMSIGKKLGLSFFLLILVVVITNGLGTKGILTLKDQWDQMQEAEELHISLVQREIEHLRWAMELQEYLIFGSSERLTLELDPTKCNFGKWLGSEDFILLLEHYPSLDPKFEKISGPHQELHASAHSIEALLLQGDLPEARRVYHEVTVPSLAQTVAILTEVRGELQDDITRSSTELNDQISRILIQTAILVAVAILFSVFIAWVVTAGITKPLVILKDAAHRIGSGDLGVHWTIKSRDEVGDLSASLEEMVNGLRNLVRGIQTSSESVNALSHGLSSMAIQTGAAITEVASTSNEFASSSVTMAENAESMRGNTNHAVAELERGLDMLRAAVLDVASARSDVQDLTQSVSSLAEQSKQIGAIVDLITEISDQTNLLALNAAIEAARAGEQGRGFAVVADEVRRLAEQSREASGDIGELIQQILRGTNETIGRMEKADGSVERVDEQIDLTGNTFVAISKVFQEVARQVTEIARAAEDVGAGSEEIAASTEEQSAIAQAIAADSEKLADLAIQLQEQIASFRGF